MSATRQVRTRHPVTDWEDALVTGSGRLGALVHSTAARTRVTLSHERLFLPVTESLPAPRTSRVLPEVRRLLLRGRSREAAALIVRTAAEEDPGYARTRWIDPLVGAAVLSFVPLEPRPGAVERRCDLDTGLVTEDLPGGVAHRVLASRPDHAVAVEITSAGAVAGPGGGAVGPGPAPAADPGDGDGLDGLLRLTLLEESPPVPLAVESETAPGLMELRVGFPARPPGTLPGYTVTCEVVAEGGRVRVVEDGLELRGAARVRILARVRVAAPEPPPGPGSRSRPGAPPVPAPETPGPGGLGDAPASGAPGTPPAVDFEGILARNRDAHGELMDRFRLRLGGSGGHPAHGSAADRAVPAGGGAPLGEDLLEAGPTPDLVARLVDAGRYAVISSCGDLPPTLQGVWSGTYDPPWRSGYTFDGNLPSAVAALHATGTPELMTSVFDLLDGMADDLAENARRLHGCRGAVLPAHASTSGRHNHFGPEWCLTCWTAGAAWMSRLYWDHYSHTRDRAFLRDRALPFLTAAGEFYEDFVTDDGLVPSYSPENTPGDGDGQAAVNATMDVAVARDLVRNLVRAHRVLDGSAPGGHGARGARRWLELGARLPGYRVARGGELAEWAGPAAPGAVEQTENHAHRHASHLYPLWYETDPALASPRLRAAAVRAVRARLGWWRGQEADEMAFGLVQLGLAAANLGLAGEAHEALGLLATRYWRPTLVPTHNRGALFNVDIGGGFPAVVAAMLVRSSEGRLDLLPALPPDWRSGRVEGLRARGGIIVDSLDWEGGAARAELRSVEPRTAVVGLPDATRRTVRVGPERAVGVVFRTGRDRDPAD
ncbi:glycosyl hydrolase family 95 catalytic domain-containing protein [Nocardiopsis sp. NPDC101807]|uniref:glycosyl hydrolase family 95 catalytic domain-containing protein n=1 Tax=Nocardiopsis sp. NPDC101807 TaxID=3364339 RepID=UPI0038170514